MDQLRDKFNGGRRSMIAAFAVLSTLAQRAGVHEDDIYKVNGEFFDGNVVIKDAWRGAILLGEIRRLDDSG